MVEAYIFLAYLARKYNIEGLSDAAVEQLGVCYLVNGIVASRAEMRQVFDYCDTSSPIGRYMVHTFRELLIRSPEYDPITAQDRADMSSSNAWAFAKEYDEVGKHVFESIRAGTLENVPPRRQLICFYHQHGPDAACAFRGKTFGEQIQSLECKLPYWHHFHRNVEDKFREVRQEESDGNRTAPQEIVAKTTWSLLQ